MHEQLFLIDCGEGTQRRLMQCGLSPMKLSAIFLTHLHGDHVFGVPPLLSTLGLLGRQAPLAIYAPAPYGEVLAAHFRHFDTQLPYPVEFHPVDPARERRIFASPTLEVHTVPLRHRTPCTGYLFREQAPLLNLRPEALLQWPLTYAQRQAAKRGERVVLNDGTELTPQQLTLPPHRPRAYAYCSDTSYSVRVGRIVQGVDLLYHEATFAAADRRLAHDTGHSTTLEAARIAARADVGRLLIGHFSSRYPQEEQLVEEARTLFPATDIAEEGRTYPLPRS